MIELPICHGGCSLTDKIFSDQWSFVTGRIAVCALVDLFILWRKPSGFFILINSDALYDQGGRQFGPSWRF